jgi:hypothetical protein
MSGIIVLILRVLLTLSLYAFLGLAIYTIWRELHLSNQLIARQKVPALTITNMEYEESESASFPTPEIIIGRETDADYPIANETVSAQHARLSYHHKQWWVEDLQSTNGTFLNDERVDTPTVIIPGDELRCGKVSLLITIEIQ